MCGYSGSVLQTKVLLSHLPGHYSVPKSHLFSVDSESCYNDAASWFATWLPIWPTC